MMMMIYEEAFALGMLFIIIIIPLMFISLYAYSEILEWNKRRKNNEFYEDLGILYLLR